MIKNVTQLDLREMGKRIKSKRQSLAMSREAFAEQIKLSPQSIYDIESGNKGTTIKRLLLISQVLGISPNYLLTGETLCSEQEQGIKRLQDEILEYLSICSVEQLKDVRDILRIYSNNLNKK